jgi:hypothetical protein
MAGSDDLGAYVAIILFYGRALNFLDSFLDSFLDFGAAAFGKNLEIKRTRAVRHARRQEISFKPQPGGGSHSNTNS